MLTVELKDAAGRTPVQFDILPSAGLPLPVVQSQLQLARHLAPTIGLRYYFLVSTDEVRGWRITDGAPVFAAPTIALLLRYAGSEDRIRGAHGVYLAQLIQAWVADLTSRWKSGAEKAPGEPEMGQSGVLEVIRAAEPTTSGSL